MLPGGKHLMQELVSTQKTAAEDLQECRKISDLQQKFDALAGNVETASDKLQVMDMTCLLYTSPSPRD
eukprot:10378110-Alexandrium_andersonii.AAC.1